MSDSEDKDYRIEFIDPEDLVQFIEQSEELSETQDEENMEDSEDQLSESEIDLPYTDQIAEEATDYVTKKKEDIRGRLAIIYTIATFIIFLIVICVAVLDGIIRKVSIIENLTTLLPLVSGIFLGTLGFVLGYYFRKENE